VFVEDVSIKGMLHGLTIRSPVARGRLEGIELPKLPNSYTLVSAKDIPGKNQLEDFPVPVLASETLSYIGEPVALLLGPDEAKLEEFAAQTRVIVREESPVLSITEFVNEFGKEFGNRSNEEFESGGVIASRNISLGKEGFVFQEDMPQVRGSYLSGSQEHWYPEPHGAAAVFLNPPKDGAESGTGIKAGKEDGRHLKVYVAAQWPSHVKRSLMGILNIDSKHVSVIPTRIGVHLDGKIWYPSLVACHAALGAFVTRKPVKIMLTREEDFCFSPKRNPAEFSIRSALGKEGEILGTEIRALTNLGAQGVFAAEILDRVCIAGLGLYRHGSVKLEGFALKTNIPPQGPLSGFGLAQGFFASERHASRIADSLGEDPAEWRKRNVMINKNGRLATGIPVKEPVPIAELIDSAAAMGDYYRKWASYELLRSRRRESNWETKDEPLRGIGIAAAFLGSGFLYNGSDRGGYAVELTLDKDSSLEIKSSIVSSGDDYIQIWKNMAVEILGLDPKQIRFKAEDSGDIPDSGPASLSRNITELTRLVERCCHAIRKQRFRDPLPIKARRISRPDKIPAWEGQTQVSSGVFAHPGWGAAVTEVEIDPVSFRPAIRGVWLAVEGGKILSQPKARRSLKTAAVHALGWTCREQIRYENGKIPADLFARYDIPSPEEFPPVYVDIIRNDTADPKGIGELPFCCIPASYVQAVSQAMDHPFEKIPLLPRDVWEAGKRNKEGA
jgi:CO/xanthine dehydrogenase Mo-binding subunit